MSDEMIDSLAEQCEALEARLAKAVGTLELIQIMDTHQLLDIETLEPCDEYIGTCGRLARDTLAELKGENHDRPATEK